MSEFIQFILANPLILIIIVGILVSSLSKLGQSSQQQEERQGNERQQGQQPQQRQQPQSQPQRQQPVERRQKEVRWEDYFPNESAPPEQAYEPVRESQSQTDESNSSRSQQELYERHREARRKVKELKDQAAPVVAIATETNQSQSNGDLNMDFKNVSRKKMMEAVVWSEVLGPPKSRNRGPRGRMSR